MQSKSAGTVFKNARIVTPDGIISGGIAVDAGKIAAVGEEQYLPSAREVFDVGGKHILPGIIDSHVHYGSYSSFAEDVQSESRLAATGGVTTHLAMVKCTRMSRTYKEITEPQDVVSYKKAFPEAKEIVKAKATIDVGFHFTIMSDELAAEIPECAEECGVTSYKFYGSLKEPASFLMPQFNQRVGLPVSWDDGTMLIGFENIAKIGGLALLHAENNQLVRVLYARGMKSGRKDLVAWWQSSPGWVEASQIATYAHLARVNNCTLYVLHTSSKDGLDEIRAARARGTKVICEVVTHYLIIDIEAPFPGILAKETPTIKDSESRNALWEGIKDGTVDCVATDHVPGFRRHMYVEGDVWKSGGGISSTQIMLPLMITEGYHKRGIPLERLVELCSCKPAKVFGLYPRKGAIQVGSDADLIVVDVDKKKIVSASEWPTSTDLSIYEGRELQGWPVLTMLRGKVIMKDGEIIGGPTGQYLYRPIGANR